MPIFDYKCKSCGTIQEFFVHLADNAPDSSCECGKSSWGKVFTPSILQLKTAVEFVKGAGTLRQQLGMDKDPCGDRIRDLERACKEQGFRPNPNSIYHPMLADFPYDKKAFLDPSDPTGDLKRKAEAHNRTVLGDYVRNEPVKLDPADRKLAKAGKLAERKRKWHSLRSRNAS